MSESRATYQVNESLIDELTTLLTPRQVAMLVTQLRSIREQGHGEICMRVTGNRLFFNKKESSDGGQLPEFPG